MNAAQKIREEGREEGRKEGKELAGRAILTTLLVIKYSQDAVDHVQEQLDALTAEEVSAAIPRVLTLKTIDAVFGPADADPA